MSTNDLHPIELTARRAVQPGTTVECASPSVTSIHPRGSLMRRVTLLCAMFIATSAAVHAQSAIPVRGTITGLEGNVLAVTTREGRDMKIELAQDAAISYPKAVKLEDLKPGTPLGTTAVAGPDGKLVASEVHVSSAGPQRREGHWDMDRPGD